MTTFTPTNLLRDGAKMFRSKAPPSTAYVSANGISVVGGIWFTTDQGTIIKSTAMTKLQNAVWAAGNNQGGMVGGAVKTALQTNHLYAIYNPTTFAVDYVFSTNATTPTLPDGFTEYRRIASFRTAAASGDFLAYYQNGDKFMLASALTVYSATGARALSLLDVLAPTGIDNLEVLLNGLTVAAAGVNGLMQFSPGNYNTQTKNQIGSYASASVVTVNGWISELTNNASKIYMLVNQASTQASLQ